MKAIVIGAGGAGLAALAALRQAGAEVVAFERSGALGGVWAATQYPALTIHSRSFNYRFHDFPPVASAGPSATRDEVRAYLEAFARAKGVAEHITYHQHVDRVVYRPGQAPPCRVRVTDVRTGATRAHDADVVVCATGFANAGRPHVPDLPGRAASQVQVLHSSEVTAEVLDDVRARRRRVAVLGAGKSSHELLTLLRGADPTWIYRKSLWALSYEVLYPASGLPWNVVGYLYYQQLARLRRRLGFGRVMRALQAPLRWSGLFVNPLEPRSDLCVNRAAIMKRDQLAYLRTVRSVKAAVTGLGPRTVEVAGGPAIEADLLICATGYDRSAWLPEVVIEAADGSVTRHDLAGQHGFYNQMIDPAVPAVSVLAASVLYPQQLVGYSLGAQWLARFHTGRLARHPSAAEMRRSMAADAARFAPWVSGAYLSNGLPYAHERNEDVLPRLFTQLGLPARLARLLVIRGANPQKFARLCDDVAARLAATA